MIKKINPKLKALLRTKPYYRISDLILQFKTHILPLLESNTPAIYHACTSILAPLDRIFNTFLSEIDITAERAFLEFNLAPPTLRRDIAMLAVLQRISLNKIHPLFKSILPSAPTDRDQYIFRRQGVRHNKQFLDRCIGNANGALKRSIFGLAAVYNHLPPYIVEMDEIKYFQQSLTEIARTSCRAAKKDWTLLFSPRHLAYFQLQVE